MQFREARRADRDAILALRERCFGDVDAEKRDPRFWEWEFRNARVFVGEESGAIATHVALVDVPYSVDGAIVRGTLAVDAMTAPEARGRGAFAGVVSFATRSSQALSTAYQIRPAVLGAMLRGGYAISQRVPVLVHPLIGAKRSVTGRGETPSAAQLASIAASATNCIARTPEFFTWRIFENPHWKYDVSTIADAAYAVTRRTTLKGHDTLAIVDLAWRDRAAARELVRNAVAEARSFGCRFAAALVSRSHAAFPLLLARGFLPSPHMFRLLVYPGSFAKRRWQVMWADTDHL